MINAYYEINQYDGTDWEDFLDRSSLIEIFQPILDTYPDPTLRKGIITYIARAYSRESPHVVQNMEWARNKKIIFESLMIHQNVYREVVLFENKNEPNLLDDEYHATEKRIKAIKQSINMWLANQDSNVNVQLCVLRDILIEMQSSATSPIRKSSGEIDYDQKFKNVNYAIELRKKISDTEKELIEYDEKLKEATKDLKATKTKKNTVSVENFVK